MTRQDGVELGVADDVELAVLGGDDRGPPRLAGHQRHLAEEVAWADLRDLLRRFSLRPWDHDSDLPRVHDEEIRRPVASFDDDLPLRVQALACPVGEDAEVFVRKDCQEVDTPKIVETLFGVLDGSLLLLLVEILVEVHLSHGIDELDPFARERVPDSIANSAIDDLALVELLRPESRAVLDARVGEVVGDDQGLGRLEHAPCAANRVREYAMRLSWRETTGERDVDRPSRDRARLRVVRDRHLRERPVGDHDLHVVGGDDLGRTPADLEDLADVTFVLVELDPIAHVERTLELDGEPREHVPERLLEGQTDDRGEERRRREERAGVDPGPAQRRDEDDEVDERLSEIADDPRERRLSTASEADVEHEDDEPTPDRGQQKQDGADDEELMEARVASPQPRHRVEGEVQDQEADGLPRTAAVRARKRGDVDEDEEQREDDGEDLAAEQVLEELASGRRRHDLEEVARQKRTLVGTIRRSVVPSPSWPARLLPQQ